MNQNIFRAGSGCSRGLLRRKLVAASAALLIFIYATHERFSKKSPQNPDEQPPRRTTQNQPANTADPNAAFPGTADEHRPGENLFTLPEMQEPQPRNPSKPQDTPPVEPITASTSMLDRETHGQLLDEPAPDGTSGITDSVINPIIAQSSALDDNNRGQ